jgi:hypothetical protein
MGPVVKLITTGVMSRLLCQQENGIRFICLVLVHKYRIKDSVHTRSVAEYPHGPCPPSHLFESPFDMVRRPYALTEGEIREFETGEKVVNVSKETLYRRGVRLFPLPAPLPRLMPRFGDVRGIIDLP